MRNTILFIIFLCAAATAAIAAENTSPLVLVKGGCFQRGDVFSDVKNTDEKPVHEVCLGDFYIGRYEMTQWQWEEVMGSNPSYFKKGDNYPVEMTSWDEVGKFLDALNRKTGKRYRLPTEAEWEYAARSGGKNEKWPGTNDEAAIEGFAWLEADSDKSTHPVGEKKPNSLGLYDMAGNVWEWVADHYDKYYYKEQVKDNPRGPSEGEYRTMRGGSWRDRENRMRTTERRRGNPTYRSNYVGFRIALTP